jgi:hypothetical protein
MPGAAVSRESTLAVLLGASEWPKARGLGASPAFKRSAEGVRSYLLDPDGFGLSPDNLLDLFDSERHAADLLEDIQGFLHARAGSPGSGKGGDLIVFYTGHGGFDGPDQEYHLAIRRTREELAGATSMRMKDLADCIRRSLPRVRRYLILDACFAAAAYKEFQSAPEQVAVQKTLAEFPGPGTALLCSSGAKNASLNPMGAERTVFSGGLLDALQRGSPDYGDALSLQDVRDLAWDCIRERFPDRAVRPEVHCPDQRQGDLARLSLFPNAFLRRGREASMSEADDKRIHADEAGEGAPRTNAAAQLPSSFITASEDMGGSSQPSGLPGLRPLPVRLLVGISMAASVLLGLILWLWGAGTAPITPGARLLQGAHAAAAAMDFDGAHKLLLKIPESSLTRDESDFKAIEGQWADWMFGKVDQATDDAEKRKLLQQIASTSTVDANRRKKAADVLGAIDAAEPAPASKQDPDVPMLPRPAATSAGTSAPAPSTAAAPQIFTGARQAPAVMAPEASASPTAGYAMDPDAAARALMPKVWSGMASLEEIRMLKALCSQVGDHNCRDKAAAMYQQKKADQQGGQ